MESGTQTPSKNCAKARPNGFLRVPGWRTVGWQQGFIPTGAQSFSRSSSCASCSVARAPGAKPALRFFLYALRILLSDRVDVLF